MLVGPHGENSMTYWMIVAAVDRGPRTYMNMVNVKASYRRKATR
jgi:hypothetical protein